MSLTELCDESAYLIMKVVVNAYSARLGGGQTYLRNIFAYLPHIAGLQIIVFAPPSLQLLSHPQLRRESTLWPTTNPLARALWEFFILPIFLRRERADLLFCPGGVAITPLPKYCRVVTMFRNMMPFDTALVDQMPWGMQRIRNHILRRVLLRSMKGADLTIFISNHARALVERLVSIPNPITIPHGIDAAFRSFGRRLPRPVGAPKGPYLLYVSRLDVYKHHREVVQGFASLPEQLRTGLQLVFLGETNLPEAESVKKLIHELELHDNVVMQGAVAHSSLPAWYQNAEALLFASSCENCPNNLLEALGSGRPVLSSEVAPMPEFGGPGLAYFSPFDPNSIRHALERVLTSPAEAERIGRAALERSVRYDWSATAQLTWKQILNLSGREQSTENGT